MKRRELVKRIEEQGAILVRHGGKHDWYQNPKKSLPACAAAQRDQRISRSAYPAKAFIEALAANNLPT